MENLQIVRGMYEAFGRGDIEAVFADCDPQIRWREAESSPYDPTGEGWTGPDAIAKNLFARLAEEWDPYIVTPREFSAAGDMVVVEGRYTGKFRATGSLLDIPFCHVFGLRDGKVESFQQYTDTAQLRAVMGAPAEARATARA